MRVEQGVAVVERSVALVAQTSAPVAPATAAAARSAVGGWGEPHSLVELVLKKAATMLVDEIRGWGMGGWVVGGRGEGVNRV